MSVKLTNGTKPLEVSYSEVHSIPNTLRPQVVRVQGNARRVQSQDCGSRSIPAIDAEHKNLFALLQGRERDAKFLEELIGELERRTVVLSAGQPVDL